MESGSSRPICREKYVRITGSGKMKVWISNSLTFLGDNEGQKALILHTFPPSMTSAPGAEGLAVNQKSASHTLMVIPRLISVVEIIKREYLQEKRSNRMRGLYQYNEIGTLEQLGVSVGSTTKDGSEATPEEARSLKIMEALTGKNHTRQSHSPFMRVTLSTIERPDLIQRGATFQPPHVRKLSKSAKARARRREKKSAALRERPPVGTIS